MALTQTDLENLDTAIASGELKVSVNGRMLEYRSIDELMTARKHVLAVLNGVVASSPVARRTGTYKFNFTTSRGN